MKSFLTLLMFFAVLGISGCFNLHDDGWGYLGDSQGYGQGDHRDSSESDD